MLNLFSVNFKKTRSPQETFRNKLLQYKIKAFHPKVQFFINFKNYIIKTADRPDELFEVLKLRKEVFYKDKPDGFVDFDRLDLMGDHILLLEKETGVPVGTYRLLSSTFTTNFYSQIEFEIDNLLLASGEKLELGRACIKEDHRNGATISLVWKGLAKYVTLTGSRYLFGCSSVFVSNNFVAYAILENLKQKAFSDEFKVRVKDSFKLDVPRIQPSQGLILGSEVLISPLLKSYIKAGAVVCSEPAFDKEMNCCDYFTILDMEKITPKYFERYF